MNTMNIRKMGGWTQQADGILITKQIQPKCMNRRAT